MTDTIELATQSADQATTARRRGLTAMRLAELQDMAAGLGISGTEKMRKGDLITAIRSQQDEGRPTTGGEPAGTAPPARRSRRVQTPAATPEPGSQNGAAVQPDRATTGEAGETRPEPDPAVVAPEVDRPGETQAAGPDNGRPQGRDEARAFGGNRAHQGNRGPQDNRAHQGNRAQQDNRAPQGGPERQDSRDGRDTQHVDNRDHGVRDSGTRDSGARDGGPEHGGPRDNRRPQRDGEDDRPMGRRRNRQRSRDRKRRGRGGPGEDYQAEQTEVVADDDVLVPVAGILDVLDNYAFVRTSGYLPGPNDVYVPLGLVKKNGLRKGDAVTGAVKALREGEAPPARQKFNALVRLDTVNGSSPDQARNRVEFNKLTPLYPQERLRLETEPGVLTTRIIDLVSPIGKGQRGLIVSPPKAGKTLILQAIANAITRNNPEAHLMVVLVDERPEEVTDMQRTVKGEVIASTFDRPADDHTTVAELAIERAKRLVELGHDVVVLLDSITRLGRAYNLAAPASGRILSGGVDSSALYPPKRFFGAARNIEEGGSLTILATALVETGSKMDEVIFEEFKGTGNMELRLSRQLADRRIFPAVDVNPSGTRREEILMSSEELKIMWKLRRVLSALDAQQGIELLIDRLKKTKSNLEFLMLVQKTSNIHVDDD